jgi:N-acetylglucosamine-6-phosphate deacetylase
VIEGLHYNSGKNVAVTLGKGRIEEIRESDGQSGGDSGANCFIAPGLVDLQINGYGGFDFNSLPMPDNLLAQITNVLWGQGVTAYLPTLVTNSAEALEAELRSLTAARSRDPLVAATVTGFHVEGPFISPQDGSRGAHRKQFVQATDWALFQRWQEAAEGNIRILTLSPEWPEAPAFIAKCADSGVIVSIGHTAASPEQIREAVAAGATMSTHLGNGAQLMLPRHPNYIWEQLAEDSLWAGIIGDGFHLPEAVLKVFLRAKGQRAMLVSDAVVFGGMAPGEYNTHTNGKVVLSPTGRLHLGDNPKLLAGSAQMLTWGIAHLVRSGLCSLDEAWDMASVRPASFMKWPAAAGLTPGAPADLVLFEKTDDGGIHILQTWKQGRLAYRKEGA